MSNDRRYLVFALACLCVALGAALAQADDAPLRTWQLGGYAIAIERINSSNSFDQDLLTIRSAGKLVHAEVAPHIDFIVPGAGGADAPQLVSITSTAAKDMVIEAFSGGAHCCFSIEVATLGDKFAVSSPLDLRDAGAALFKLPDGALYGFRSADEAYAHRWTSFVSSPSPEILLRYDADKGFTVAIDLMRKPRTAAEIQQLAAKMRADKDAWKAEKNSPTAEYLRTALDLVYTGDLKGAQVYAKTAWPDGRPGRKDFIDDLNQCALPASPWWTAIAELNGIKPYPAAKDCKP
jgi:hypothetical protein